MVTNLVLTTMFCNIKQLAHTIHCNVIQVILYVIKGSKQLKTLFDVYVQIPLLKEDC
jgi:hypothetical protein